MVIFQWVPSHVVLLGNGIANEPKPVLLYILKEHPHKLTQLKNSWITK